MPAAVPLPLAHVLASLAQRGRQVAAAAQRAGVCPHPLSRRARGGLQGDPPCFLHAGCRAEPAAGLLVPTLFRRRRRRMHAVRRASAPGLLLLLLLGGGSAAQLLQLRVGAAAAERGAGAVTSIRQLLWASPKGVCKQHTRRGGLFSAWPVPQPAHAMQQGAPAPAPAPTHLPPCGQRTHGPAAPAGLARQSARRTAGWSRAALVACSSHSSAQYRCVTGQGSAGKPTAIKCSQAWRAAWHAAQLSGLVPQPDCSSAR